MPVWSAMGCQATPPASQWPTAPSAAALHATGVAVRQPGAAKHVITAKASMRHSASRQSSMIATLHNNPNGNVLFRCKVRER